MFDFLLIIICLLPLFVVLLELVIAGVKGAASFVNDSGFNHEWWGEVFEDYGYDYVGLYYALMIGYPVIATTIVYCCPQRLLATGITYSPLLFIITLVALRYLRRFQKTVFNTFKFVHKHSDLQEPENVDIKEPSFK